MVPYGGGPLKAPGINGVKSCILAISWQQNWPFRNYNLKTHVISPQEKKKIAKRSNITRLIANI
jgi:hypothetical protein